MTSEDSVGPQYKYRVEIGSRKQTPQHTLFKFHTGTYVE